MGFRIDVVQSKSTTPLYYDDEQFGIAQAVFNIVASRMDNDNVRLVAYWKGDEDGEVLLCNKEEYQEALKAHKTNAIRNGGLMQPM